MSKYLKQLSLDLPRWVGLGYVSEPNAALILGDAEANQKEGWFRLPLILSMLGMLLVFAGVISWVAGNWDDIPRLVRVLLLIGAMLGSFITAHYFRERGSDGLAQGFAFLGALMFGADIMLIAQIYQLPANPPGGALLWALGAALVAFVWPSQLSMALAFALAGVWTWFAASLGSRDLMWGLLFDIPHAVHWPFLLLWGVLAACSVKRGWTKALHVAGLVLCFWYAHSLMRLFDFNFPRFAGLMLVALLIALTLAGRLLQIMRPGAGIVSKYVWMVFVLWLLLMSAPDVYRHGMPMTANMMFIYMLCGAIGAAVLVLASLKEREVGYLAPLGGSLLAASMLPLLTYMVSLGALVSAIMAAVLVMAMAVGSIVYGYRSNERFFINTGFVLFAFKLIWLYFDNAWSLAGRAPFFIIGGLLVVGLGVVFDRQRRKLILMIQDNANASSQASAPARDLLMQEEK